MSNFDLQINEKNKQDLLIAAKWAKFLAIIGYVGMGFMVLAGFILIVAGSNVSSGIPGFPTSALSVFYFLIAAFYFFPVTFMYRMSKNLKEAIQNSTQTNFDLGVSNLSKLFKFTGYMVVGILVLYMVIIIGVMVMAMVSGLG